LKVYNGRVYDLLGDDAIEKTRKPEKSLPIHDPPEGSIGGVTAKGPNI